MDRFCSGDLLIVWFVCAVVPAPMVGFEWFSHLLDLAQLSSRIFSPKHWEFLFSSSDTHNHLSCFFRPLEADCGLFQVAPQKVLRRKLLAPTSKDGGSMVHLRLDNLSNKKPGSSSYASQWLSQPTECYKLNLEGKLLNQGFLSGNWCGVINNLLCSICNLAGASVIWLFFFFNIKVYRK